MEPQQLAGKVAQLESRVATLEDEGKIVKGEIKQILTEIRTAVLVRDNPFESTTPAPATVNVVSTAPPAEPVAKVELVMPKAEQHDEPPTAPAPEHAAPAPAPTAAPTPLRPVAAYVPPPAPVSAAAPRWSLLTIAGLSAWGEEAVRRLGPLRLEILLDLCEAAGHISSDARSALSRVTEMEMPEPEQAPSPNETAAMLRQLDALVNDEDSFGMARRSA